MSGWEDLKAELIKIAVRIDKGATDAKSLNSGMLGLMKISKTIVSLAAVTAFAFMAGTMIIGCQGTKKETTTTTTTETSPGADASPDVTQKSTDSTTTSSAPDSGTTTTKKSTTEKSSN
jgi:hypothetical protein